MLDANSLSNCEIVCGRQDDLPCCQCDEYGDIIVKVEERTYDVCPNCAVKRGIRW